MEPGASRFIALAIGHLTRLAALRDKQQQTPVDRAHSRGRSALVDTGAIIHDPSVAVLAPLFRAPPSAGRFCVKCYAHGASRVIALPRAA